MILRARVLALLIAIGGAASPAPAQMCNCTCDNLPPACFVISRFFMNESGGAPTPPTEYLTAGIGTVPPTSAEVRHANRFSITPGTTLTHVCIALKNPSGPAASGCAGGDGAYIFIAVHDNTTGLPGAVITQTNFTVQPCIGLAIRHQLVAFSTPQAFPLGADVWVGVGYPTAQVTIGHQGNRARTSGSSAVWIGGTLSRWFSYDDPQLGSFNGRAPIIRALQLVRGGGRVDASPGMGLITDENGLSAQFQVFLASAQPLANVTINITTTDATEGVPTAGSAMLTFTPANWNIPQTVTVVGQDDTLIDGDIPYQITGTAASIDPCYDTTAGATAFAVNLTNLDNDGPCALRWTNSSPPVGPPARQHHAMAYDPGRGRIVMFGGLVGGLPVAGVWEYDPFNNSWMSVPALGGPSARYGHAMAYDATSGRVVLVGGTNNITYFSDAWAWNGSTWTALPAAPGPGRRWHAMSANPATGGLLICGGQDAAGAALPDASEYASGVWSPAVPLLFPGGPVRRSSHAMAPASGGSGVFLFGGWDPAPPPTLFPDTWNYVPGGWSQVAGAAPSARISHAMAPFRPRNAAAMFGGTSGPGAFFADTRTLALPVGWTVRATMGLPSARAGHAMAAVDGENRIILFGGSTLLGALGDTWELSDPTYPTITATGGMVVQAGTSFSQNVTVTAAVFGSYTYQWYKDGLPLSNSARISGANMPTLSIGPASLTDSGHYWVVVTSSCGPSVTSSRALIDVNCTADFNNDNMVTVADIFAYLTAWFAGSPTANVCAPNTVTVADIFCFLTAWFAGCP